MEADAQERRIEITSPTGYSNGDYAASLSEFGSPCLLAESGGWILKRRIPDSEDCDATGCYPLFVCRNWSRLQTDLDGLADNLVSLVLVTDPFGDYEENYLRKCFPDHVALFKQHFVVDLRRSPQDFVNSHHQRNARKAMQAVEVERCETPAQFLDEWTDLYANLSKRHRVRGMAVFSKTSFARQLAVPGITMFRATYQGKGVGMLLWYAQDRIGYYHLGAFSKLGYELRASFALFWHALEYFSAQRLSWLTIGAGAGLESKDYGLTSFKRGWSTGTRAVYICGRIFNPERYATLLANRRIGVTNYFPAYRQGEL